MSGNRRKFLKHSIWGGLLSSLGHTINYDYPSGKREKLDFNSWETLREQFLLSKDRKFFNTASLGASPISVIDTYDQWSRKLESRSETGHGNVNDCRNTIASHFNVSPEEIAITRNTTEGINIVANGLELKRGDEILLTSHEHVGGSVPWMNLAQRNELIVKTVDLNLSGKNNAQIIIDAINPRTKVISISHVTCTNGMILPIKEIVNECRNRSIYTCIDGAQAPGMMSVDLRDLDPDFYATSGHKWLFGPKGTGVLFINKKVIDKLKPTFAGAYTTEEFDLSTMTYSYRNVAEREEYGTRNTPLFMALKEAFDFQEKIGVQKIEEHGRNLAKNLRSELEGLPSVEILTPGDNNLHGSILTFRSSRIPYQELQKQLHNDFKCRVRGIYENRLDAIRVSCAIYNSKEEVEFLSNSIKTILTN